MAPILMIIAVLNDDCVGLCRCLLKMVLHCYCRFVMHWFIIRKFFCEVISLLTRLQEAAFRKVVQATMIRDRQHGPVIEINRIQVRGVSQPLIAVAGHNAMSLHFC